jgi:VanZ family protein
LAYLVATTLLITWAPFAFTLTPMHGFSTVWTWSDLILNVVMFLPLGFFAQSARVREREIAWWMIGLAGALLSATIEIGQLFLAERFSSVFDVCTNGLGAAIGARAFQAVRPHVRLGRGAVSALALELPLMGLVMLLVPLLWVAGFASAGTERVWLMLLIATFGGALIGAVHGAYLDQNGRVSRGTMVLAVAVWFVVAALPGAAEHVDVLVAGATLAIGCAWLRSRSTSRARARNGDQRVELLTLRIALPLFAAYFTLASLWPLDAVDGVWRGAWALAPSRDGLSRVLLMQSLEYLAGFTLVGYISAEFHGRSNESYRTISRRVMRYVLALLVMLETARGWNTAQGASLAIALLAVASGLFGGWLYHLQRDHIRTLLQRT